MEKEVLFLQNVVRQSGNNYSRNEIFSIIREFWVIVNAFTPPFKEKAMLKIAKLIVKHSCELYIRSLYQS